MMGEFYGALPTEAANAPGHNVVLYLPHDSERLDVDLVVGRHYEAPVPDGVELLELPGGDVAETVHAGEYAELYRAHEATGGWVAAGGRALAGPNWEIYEHWSSDPADLRTRVRYLLA